MGVRELCFLSCWPASSCFHQFLDLYRYHYLLVAVFPLSYDVSFYIHIYLKYNLIMKIDNTYRIVNMKGMDETIWMPRRSTIAYVFVFFAMGNKNLYIPKKIISYD